MNWLKKLVFDVAIPGRHPLRSWTLWGLALYLGAEAFSDAICDQGLLKEEICNGLQAGLKGLGTALTALGIRRAAMTGPQQ